MEEFKDNRAQSPWRPAARFGIRKSASNSGHSPLRGLGVGLGVGLGDDRGPDRPMAALHFLLPTGDSRSGRRSFDSKHLPPPARRGSRSRPPLRRPRRLRFERLRVPVWNPYSRGRLGPAKSEDRKGRLAPQLARHALGRLPTPPPLPENLLLRLHRKLPSVPPASTQEVSESENRPATRGTAHSEVQGDERSTERGNA